MTEMVARLDDFGRPAWLAVMVLAFIVFWPIGLAILAFLIWSGRMGCGRNGEVTRWQARMADKWEGKMHKWSGERRGSGFARTGNAAFDEYRADTLRRLEEEAREFRDYLDRLRMDKDRAEFEQFMSDRRNRPTPEPGNPPPSAA